MQPVSALIVLILSSIFLFCTIPSHSANSCQPSSCNANGPIVRFPFRLAGHQPVECGYPNFNLHCNSHNQTILNLPNSGEFIILEIDYATQSVVISDPGSCLPNRIMNFSLAGSPFHSENTHEFTFLNCSLSWRNYTFSRYMPLFCLSGEDYTVMAMNSHVMVEREVPETCEIIKMVTIPAHISFYYWSARELREELDLELVWAYVLNAGFRCETMGGICGYVESGGGLIGCSMPPRSVLPRSAKYGIMIGVGIPGVIFFVGLLSYMCGTIKAMRDRRRLNSQIPLSSIFYRYPTLKISNGLDSPTIESFPKTVLGESRRLPKDSDTTCAICLGEYKPKETLRSIPECDHYFHADCIDEWLKLNGTCPLCRKSPDSS